MTDPEGPEPPPRGTSSEIGIAPGATDVSAGDVAPNPKAVEARAMAELQAHLHEVTPRIGVAAVIVAANVMVYVAMVLAGVSWIGPTAADLAKWGGNYGPRTLGGQPWRIVTAAFLHAGFIHLAMNMFALWSSGPVIERIFGRARLATIYFCAAVAGGVASVAVHPQITSVGASGAVFGLYGALAAFLLRERGSIAGPAITRLSRVAASFIIYNIVFGFTQPAIDNAAHLGGLFGGALAGAWLARPLVVDRAAAPGRLVAAQALAAVALVGSSRALPTPPDFQAAVAQFGAVESRTIDAYNALVGRAHKGELTDEDFASGIERDVLPPWRAGRAALMVPRRWTPAQRAVLDRLDHYNEARERAWVLFVRAGRTKAPEDLAAAKDAQAETTRLLEEMKQTK